MHRGTLSSGILESMQNAANFIYRETGDAGYSGGGNIHDVRYSDVIVTDPFRYVTTGNGLWENL